MPGIEEVISRLRVDSSNADFTGFVTNAYVVDATLRGEVWQHQRAEDSGLFADGHRIVTSRIIDIEGCGDSVWFETESGSRYGIISFSTMGLINLSRLRDVDGFPAWPPREKHVNQTGEAAKESRSLDELLKKRSARLQQSPPPPYPFRPPKNPSDLWRYKESFERSLSLIKRYAKEYEELVSTDQLPKLEAISDHKPVELNQKYRSTFKDFDLGSSIRECGPGWLKIVETFCSLLQEGNERADSDKAYIQRVVGKLGSLHILMTGRSPEIAAWINFVERHSTRTCEVCGCPGRLFHDLGWQRTRCEVHRTQSVDFGDWFRG